MEKSRKHFLDKVKDIILKENQNYTQDCLFMGHDDPEGKWKKVTILDISGDVTIYFSQSFGYLDIEGLTDLEFELLSQKFPTYEEAYLSYMSSGLQ